MATVFLLFRDLMNLKHLGYTSSYMRLSISRLVVPCQMDLLFIYLQHCGGHTLWSHSVICQPTLGSMSQARIRGRLGCTFPKWIEVLPCLLLPSHGIYSLIGSHTQRKRSLRGLKSLYNHCLKSLYKAIGLYRKSIIKRLWWCYCNHSSLREYSR